MAEARQAKIAVSLTLILLSFRVSLQDFICPIMCQCEELILTTDCKNTFSLNPGSFYNISSLTSVLLLERNELLNVSDILPWDRLANLRKLSLASNRIEIFEDGTLSLMEGLLYIDFSHNSLYNVPAELRLLTRVKYLDLSDNFIAYVETDDFVNFQVLGTLKLTNSLKLIGQGAFNSFSHIEYVDLSGSDFSSMPKCLELGFWFGYSNSSSSLKEIYLSKANVCLSDGTFSGFRNLQTVDVRSNNIPVLPETLLIGLDRMKKLDLADNSISEIPVDFFIDSRALESLDISRNNLSTIGNINVKFLRRLRSLNLAVNYISEPSPLDFRILRNLRELNLKNNRIREFPVVHNLRKLESLDLSKNFISEITSTALRDCKKLEEVHINSNNRLSLFDLDTTNLGSMRTFSMTGNGIYCDCHLLQFYKSIRGRYGEDLPRWLVELFQKELCKLDKFEGAYWYDAPEYFEHYMICSQHSSPVAIGLLVGSWMVIILSIVTYIWLRSICSSQRKWHSNIPADGGRKHMIRRMVRKVPTRQVVARSAAARTEPPPVWEEKEKLLTSSGGEETEGGSKLSAEKWKAMTETFV